MELDEVIVEILGEVEMPYDKIEQGIIDALNAFFPIAMQLSSSEWTISIRAIFSKLGHENKCKVAAKRPTKDLARQRFEKIRQLVKGDNPDHTEWLYDILWWHEGPPDHMKVPLVAESEWGNRNAFKFDFQKLLLAKVEHKVMIFECGDGVITWAKEQIKQFKDTQGERYLFCSWHGKGVDKFKYELFIAP
ncbi:MAG TPA: hypothetical protein PKI41_04905 [Candidatus Competibacteraceae bacterium]|nr:hypothetical protein [Candidatus Competibacteraceae bacterium]HQA25480.1 hypothetical protein [Candidatus Competibacteraceae bacterium]HQD55917.1 hypothetical protein [Candidatus Competibacteraceae bacterium]